MFLLLQWIFLVWVSMRLKLPPHVVDHQTTEL